VNKFLLMSILLVPMGLSAAPVTMISPFQVNTAAGYTISSSGLYILSDNVTASAAPAAAITITSSNVVLDLNNKTISGFSVANIIGIQIAGNIGNVIIKNGVIANVGLGVVSVSAPASDISIENVSVERYANEGIEMMNVQGITISDCVLSGSSLSSGFGIDLFNVVQGKIKNCKSSKASVGIIIANSSATKFESVEAYSNNLYGLRMQVSQGVQVVDSTFNNNVGDGVNFVSSVTHCTLSNCQMNNNNNGLTMLDAFSVNNIIQNCMAFNNGNNGFDNPNTNVLIGNLAYGNATNYTGGNNTGFITIGNAAQPSPDILIAQGITNISIV
jgi:hypothetical protein